MLASLTPPCVAAKLAGCLLEMTHVPSMASRISGASEAEIKIAPAVLFALTG